VRYCTSEECRALQLLSSSIRVRQVSPAVTLPTTFALLVLALCELLLALLLTLPLVLLNLLRRTVLDEIAVIVDAAPLRQAVRDIHDPLLVEHMKSMKSNQHAVTNNNDIGPRRTG